jgi:hypothetical protein
MSEKSNNKDKVKYVFTNLLKKMFFACVKSSAKYWKNFVTAPIVKKNVQQKQMESVIRNPYNRLFNANFEDKFK